MSYGSTQDHSILINNRLLNTRLKHNHSQEDVAEYTNLSLTTIFRIEKGYYTKLFNWTLYRINKYLETYENMEVKETEIPTVKEKIITHNTESKPNFKTITTPYGDLTVPENCSITFQFN